MGLWMLFWVLFIIVESTVAWFLLPEERRKRR